MKSQPCKKKSEQLDSLFTEFGKLGLLGKDTAVCHFLGGLSAIVDYHPGLVSQSVLDAFVLGISFAQSLTPKGLHPIAQGCDSESYPGSAPAGSLSNPEGVASAAPTDPAIRAFAEQLKPRSVSNSEPQPAIEI